MNLNRNDIELCEYQTSQDITITLYLFKCEYQASLSITNDFYTLFCFFSSYNSSQVNTKE